QGRLLHDDRGRRDDAPRVRIAVVHVEPSRRTGEVRRACARHAAPADELAVATTKKSTGDVAALRTLADRVPRGHERVVRELAQKECEADLRAHDALISRGNTQLAASGVAVSLLLGLSKETVVD